MIFYRPTRSILLGAAVAMSLLGLPSAFAQVSDQPNIVLILSDDKY